MLAGHVTVGGSETSSEKSMMLGRDHVLLLSDVALPQLDYVALGHIHRRQVLRRDPHVVYPGSLQRIDFGEEHDTKGFCVLDLDPAQPQGKRLRDFQFVPVNARPFLTIRVKIRPGDADPTATVVEALRRQPLEGAVVKVAIEAPAELDAHLREGEIVAALEDAHFVAAVSRELSDQQRPRLGEASSDALRPAEALRRYFEIQKVPAERVQLLMRRAEELMSQERAS